MLQCIARAVVSALALGPVFVHGSPVATFANSTGGHNMVYFTSWGVYNGYTPDKLPVDKMTAAIYAFVNLHPNGTVFPGDPWADVDMRYPGDSWVEPGNNVYGNIKQLYLLKKHNRNLKVLLSVGGWTYRENFAPAVSTPEGVAEFARTSVALMRDWGFDGIDVDWEAPEDAAQAANHVSLMKAIRAELEALAARTTPGYHFLLTAAVPASPLHYNILDIAGLASVLDYFLLMAYDFSGFWFPTSAHHANLFPSTSNPNSTPSSAIRAVTDYRAAGATRSQIVLGMPVYGRPFQNTAGPGQPYEGTEPALLDYNTLPKPGAIEFYDKEAGATYSYDEALQEFVTYDTAEMVTRKVEWLGRVGLGGSMFWEASTDRTDEGSLIGASFKALGGLAKAQNLLSYPESQYDNMRAGIPD